MEQWLLIYRTYSDAELAAEVTALKSWAANPFNAQTEGNRSYARSTVEIRERLTAATQVQQERVNTVPRHGIADFSRVEV